MRFMRVIIKCPTSVNAAGNRLRAAMAARPQREERAKT